MNKKDYHAKGQKSLKGKNDPPIDGFRSFFGMYDKEDLRRQREYNAGRKNAKKQQKKR